LSEPKAAKQTSVAAGGIFLVLGIVSIDISILYDLQVPALIGLALVFWGVIFLLIAPKDYFDVSLITSAVTPEYSTFDRMANELKYKKGYYIPTLLSDTGVPEHLKKLKDPVVFVSVGADFRMPSIDDISKGSFLVARGNGVLLTPPGLGLLKQIEKKMKTKITRFDINEICQIVAPIIHDDYALAKELTLKTQGDNVHLTVENSIYKDLYNTENGSKSVLILGCPIASAIACLLAQVSGKTITIAETKVSPNASTVEIEYQIVS